MSAKTPETSEACRAWLASALAPAALPPGISSREIVRRAIDFERPPRVPYAFRPPRGSDFFELCELERLLDDASGPSRAPGETYVDRWGVTYRKTRFAWDEAIGHPLRDLFNLEALPREDAIGTGRIARLAPFVRRAQQAGKYVVGTDPVLLHERQIALMGFEDAMTAPHLRRDALDALLDRLTDLTVAAAEALGSLGGVDAFMTWQDVGGEQNPWIAPAMLREIYEPRYARIVEAAHRVGMDCIWHVCGQVEELIPRLIEIGVDVIQLDQPRLIGHRKLAERFGGRVCFWNAVDIQWATGPAATGAGIDAEIEEMLEPFAGFGGGIMVRHYQDPAGIGLQEEFHDASYQAFLRSEWSGSAGS